MRKLMVTAATLAMLLVPAAPAFAEPAMGGNVHILRFDAPQSAAVMARQTQRGNATATSGDLGSAADAGIHQNMHVSMQQVNGGWWFHKHFGELE